MDGKPPMSRDARGPYRTYNNRKPGVYDIACALTVFGMALQALSRRGLKVYEYDHVKVFVCGIEIPTGDIHELEVEGF